MGSKRVNDLLEKHRDYPILPGEQLDCIVLDVLDAALKELGIGDEPEPAEPVVLSAEDTAVHVCKNMFFPRQGVRMESEIMYFGKLCAEKGKEGGRLERELELKPLTNAIKEESKDYSKGFDIVRIMEAIENLKPLNKG